MLMAPALGDVCVVLQQVLIFLSSVVVCLISERVCIPLQCIRRGRSLKPETGS